MKRILLFTGWKSLVLCWTQEISSAGQATAIVLVVIVKVHSLEDKRTLRDSRRILISSFLEEPLKSS